MGLSHFLFPPLPEKESTGYFWLSPCLQLLVGLHTPPHPSSVELQQPLETHGNHNVSGSVASDFATPRMLAHQVPLSMGFSRHKYWSRFPFASQGIFPIQGWNQGLRGVCKVWALATLSQDSLL